MTDDASNHAAEDKEWAEAIASVIAVDGPRRADELLVNVVDIARRSGAKLSQHF